MILKLISNMMIGFLSLIFLNEIQSQHICDDGIIDTITVLKNGTIVLFRKKDLYFMNHKIKELIGPLPLNTVYNEMKGPIDAAITITSHKTVTEFIGSSIYFENGNFFSFKNLGPYQVEWGNLVYLPHKGLQANIGKTDSNSKKLMIRKMSAAYFDPIDKRNHFVFSDGSILGFYFELGVEYDKPIASNLSAELKKYGVDKPVTSVDAAFTLSNNNIDELYLFSESNFCSFKLIKESTEQKCEMKSTKDQFLNCKDIKRIVGQSGTASAAGRGVSIESNNGHKSRKNGMSSRLETDKSSESLKSDSNPIIHSDGAKDRSNAELKKLSKASENSGYSGLLSTNNILPFILNLLLLLDL